MLSLLPSLSTLWNFAQQSFNLLLVGIGVFLLIVSYGIAYVPQLQAFAALGGKMVMRITAFALIGYGGVQLYTNWKVTEALATAEARQAQAVAAAREEETKRGDAAVAKVLEEQKKQYAQVASLREQIRNVPVQSTCASSPAIRAVINSDFMRHPGTGAGSDNAARSAPTVGLRQPAAPAAKPN